MPCGWLGEGVRMSRTTPWVACGALILFEDDFDALPGAEVLALAAVHGGILAHDSVELRRKP